MLSPEEIRKGSVAEITNRDMYSNNAPVVNGLFDSRMGVLEKGLICPTDGKDYMNTPSSKFGSKCDVTDKFIEKVAKMGVMDAACAITEVKENKAAKKTDGTKSKSIRGIPKLDDANWAGVVSGAEDGIKKAGLNVKYSKKVLNNVESGMDWWNGIFIVVVSR
jgi:hypothetical protein